MFKSGDRVVTIRERLPFFDTGCTGTVVNVPFTSGDLEVLFDGRQKVNFCLPEWVNPLYLKLATTCRVTKHKEEYREKIRPLNEAVHRANDPATSKGKRKVNKYAECVVYLLQRNPGGLTGKEIAGLSGFPLNCVTPRFAPLRRKNLIKAKRDAMGQVEKRDKQIVWVMT
jgi:hypothetical protein